MTKMLVELEITATAEVITAADKLAILHREATDALGTHRTMDPGTVLKIIEEGRL